VTTPARTRRQHRPPVDDPERTVGRYAALEGYRGLAALLIVIYHVYQFVRAGPDSRYPYEGTVWHTVLVGLDAFVGLFFVLSAFLLGLQYARAALSASPPLSARMFLYRRAVRIVPLYLVAILIVWSARNDTFPGDWRDLLEHLTFTQVFDNKRIFYTIGPAWSLAVEVHFYLLLALLGSAACLLCRRLSDRRRRLWVLAGGVVALFAASVLWKVVAWYVIGVDDENWWVWFSLPAKLDLFAIGLGLAVVVAARENAVIKSRAVRAALLWAGLAVVAVAFATQSTGPDPNIYFHTGTGLGFGLMLASSVLAPAGANWFLGARIPTLLGLISYSLYLWHEPVLLSLAGNGWFPEPGSPGGFPLGVLILVPVSCAVAWLSYWVIEYPTGHLRRLRDSSGARREYYDGR
jgi:peptidoglycan/LPS O-acetylase OafA/YrhL